jgi:hypothetical protein
LAAVEAQILEATAFQAGQVAAQVKVQSLVHLVAQEPLGRVLQAEMVEIMVKNPTQIGNRAVAAVLEVLVLAAVRNQTAV